MEFAVESLSQTCSRGSMVHDVVEVVDGGPDFTSNARGGMVHGVVGFGIVDGGPDFTSCSSPSLASHIQSRQHSTLLQHSWLSLMASTSFLATLLTLLLCLKPMSACP